MFQRFRKGRRERKAKTENAAHCGAENLGRKEIGTFRTEQNTGEASGIRSADNGAHIAGILNSVQSKQARTGSLAGLERQDSSDTLGSLGVTDRLENVGREDVNGNISWKLIFGLIIFSEKYCTDKKG